MPDQHQFDFDVLPPESTKGMVRRNDLPAAHKAAEAVLPILSKLQARVLMAFEQHGPMIDEELVALPEFSADYGPTVWRRRSDLSKLGKLINIGEKLNRRGQAMTLWKLS